MFTTRLHIEKIPGTIHWVLIDPLVWEDEMLTVSVPRGFKTDLTTRWFEGRHTEASVVHDYLLDTGHPFPVANEMMRRAMIDLDVRPWRRAIIMLGITAYGHWHEFWHGD